MIDQCITLLAVSLEMSFCLFFGRETFFRNLKIVDYCTFGSMNWFAAGTSERLAIWHGYSTETIVIIDF